MSVFSTSSPGMWSKTELWGFSSEDKRWSGERLQNLKQGRGVITRVYMHTRRYYSGAHAHRKYVHTGTDPGARRRRLIPGWCPAGVAEWAQVRPPPRWEATRLCRGGHLLHSCAGSSPDREASRRCPTGSPWPRTERPPHRADSHLHRAVETHIHSESVSSRQRWGTRVTWLDSSQTRVTYFWTWDLLD